MTEIAWICIRSNQKNFIVCFGYWMICVKKKGEHKNDRSLVSVSFNLGYNRNHCPCTYHCVFSYLHQHPYEALHWCYPHERAEGSQDYPSERWDWEAEVWTSWADGENARHERIKSKKKRRENGKIQPKQTRDEIGRSPVIRNKAPFYLYKSIKHLNFQGFCYIILQLGFIFFR